MNLYAVNISRKFRQFWPSGFGEDAIKTDSLYNPIENPSIAREVLDFFQWPVFEQSL